MGIEGKRRGAAGRIWLPWQRLRFSPPSNRAAMAMAPKWKRSKSRGKCSQLRAVAMATLYNQYQYKLSWAAVKHPLSSATPDQRTTTPSSRGINLPSLLPPSILPPADDNDLWFNYPGRRRRRRRRRRKQKKQIFIWLISLERSGPERETRPRPPSFA